MKALRTASAAPNARGTAADTAPGKRTQVEAQGNAAPRPPGSAHAAPSVSQQPPASSVRNTAAAPTLLDLFGSAPQSTPLGAPPALDGPRSTPRASDEVADLALDCVGAITLTESGGHAQESHLHTASGVRASYANVAQQITSKTVSILG
jgi:hypothetical protein